MARRSGLGKGLGSLIPPDVMGDHASALLEIPIAAIAPNPHQPRQHFDEDSLAGLTASIRELGVLQPVLVRRLPDERFELIAGERRWRSARRAGLSSLPAVVRDTTAMASLEEALVENLHRDDLNPMEEAAAYQQLIEDFGLTHERLSARVGRSRTSITNTLRLFQLPPPVQKLVGEGELSAGHARAILGTPDRAFQEALARQAVDEQLSVRAVEEAVRLHDEPDSEQADDPVPEESPRARPANRLRPPGLLELEELLSDHLDTRVHVDFGARRGKVVIDFADLEDLERIYRAMHPGGTASPADS